MMNVRPVDSEASARDGHPRLDGEEIWEVELLLPGGHVRGLIEAARRQGLTAGALARRLIADFLRRYETAQP
jgi:hypothetical protein